MMYSQTSMLNSTGSTNPGLYHQFGTLAGAGSHRKDFYEIIANTGETDVSVDRVTLYGKVNVDSTVVLVPVVVGSVIGPEEPILIPDRNNVLRSATAPAMAPSDPLGTFTIVFDTPVTIPAGGRIAVGFIVPMVDSVEATLLGTDTLPNDLGPGYWTGLYVSKVP